MIIGNFSYNPENNTYAGFIRTLSFDRPNVHIRPNRKAGEMDPDFRVVEDSGHGAVELGAAWSRRSEKGTSFLSVLLDCPGMAQPLSVALFDNGQGQATLVWTRPKARTNDANPAPQGESSLAERPTPTPAPAQRRRRSADGHELHA